MDGSSEERTISLKQSTWASLDQVAAHLNQSTSQVLEGILGAVDLAEAIASDRASSKLKGLFGDKQG